MKDKLKNLYPLVFAWENVPRPWGGRHLGEPIKGIPIGERWLLSALQGHESIVRNGVLEGQNLRFLLDYYSLPLLGNNAQENSIPLIKWIDTLSPLSIQVHPDDAFAQLHGQPNGKSEMWYILEATEGSRIYAGFKQALDKAALRKCIEEATLVEQMANYSAHKGDIYFVPGGLVHALGGGIQLLEVQQPSDTTYRLYDWGRTDAHGNKRELHVELGCAATCLSQQVGIRHDALQTERESQELINIAPLYLAKHVVREDTPLFFEKEYNLRSYLSLNTPFILSWTSEMGASSVLVNPMEVVVVPACISSYRFALSNTQPAHILEFAITT